MPEFGRMESATKRVRTRKACVPCSKRKRKCSGTLPCSACDGYGYECTYRDDDGELKLSPALLGPASAEGVAGETRAVSLPLPTFPKIGNVVERGGQATLLPEGGDLEKYALDSSRFMGRHSEHTFPRLLGLELQSETVPKTNSSGWNLQIRDIPECQTKPAIRTLITWEQANAHIIAFFRMEFPPCGFLKQAIVLGLCQKHWYGYDQGLPFEALVSGVIGLASLFAPKPLPEETKIFDHAKAILEDASIISTPSVIICAATVLRGLYLRAVANPHASWQLTCSFMHMAEALGLHKAVDTITRVDLDPSSFDSLWDAQSLACLFWTACAANRISSHEIGRSPVTLQGVTCKFPFQSSDHSGPACFCQLGCLLPMDLESSSFPVEHALGLAETLAKIRAEPTAQHFVKLVAADVCFCFYRRMSVNNQHFSKHQCQQFIDIGRTAVETVKFLVQRGEPWWNLLNTLFHFTCVLISMDSFESLSNLKEALVTIKLVGECFSSPAVSDVLSTVHLLTRALQRRKARELALLRDCDEGEIQPNLFGNPFDVTDDTLFGDPFEFLNTYWDPSNLNNH